MLITIDTAKKQAKIDKVSLTSKCFHSIKEEMPNILVCYVMIHVLKKKTQSGRRKQDGHKFKLSLGKLAIETLSQSKI